jgi:GNAT superfamily N-acetyltransferase
MFYRTLIRDPNTGALIISATDSGKVVGYAAAEVRARPAGNFVQSIGEISELVITPEYDGTDAGEKLFATAQAFFERQGVARVFVTQAAVRFAASNGYAPMEGDSPGRLWRTLREGAGLKLEKGLELTVLPFSRAVAKNLSDWLNVNGRFTWVTERYNNAEAMLELDKNKRVQVVPYGGIMAHPDLDLLRLNKGGESAAPGALGQITLNLFAAKDGRTALLIQGIEPGEGFMMMGQLQRRNLDAWRRGAVERIAEWGRQNNFLVYAATPEVIQSVYGELSDLGLRMNFGWWSEEGPFDPATWNGELLTVHADAPMRWYSYFRNDEVMRLPVRRLIVAPPPANVPAKAPASPGVEENAAGLRAFQRILWALQEEAPPGTLTRFEDAGADKASARIGMKFGFRPERVGGSMLVKALSAPSVFNEVEIYTGKGLLEDYVARFPDRLTQEQMVRLSEFMSLDGAKAATAALDLSIVPVFVQSGELFRVAREHMPAVYPGIAFKLIPLPDGKELEAFNWGEMGLALENEMLEPVAQRPAQIAPHRVYPTAEAVAKIDPVNLLALGFRNLMGIPGSQSVQAIIFTDGEGKAHIILMYA